MTARRLLVFAAAGLLVVGLAYVVTAFLMVRGAISAERHPLEGSPATYGMAYEEVSFEPRGGGPLLRGWFMEADPDAPVLIFVHGLDSQRTGNDGLEIAVRLHEEGFSVLLFDLRGHGESDGERVSGGYFERFDVLGAYDALTEQGVPSGEIGLVGFSMGAGIAVMAASQEPGITGVVADSPFASVDDLIVQETARRTPIPRVLVPLLLPGSKLIASTLHGIHLNELNPEASARQLAYPILVVHGEEDERIPPSHGRRVHASAPAGSELWLVPGAEHVRSFDLLPNEYVSRVVAYLDARFSRADSSRDMRVPRQDEFVALSSLLERALQAGLDR